MKKYGAVGHKRKDSRSDMSDFRHKYMDSRGEMITQRSTVRNFRDDENVITE